MPFTQVTRHLMDDWREGPVRRVFCLYLCCMRRLLSLPVLAILITAPALPAQELLSGYNTAHIFQQFPDHRVNAEAIQLFDALDPDVLRFPGGTIGNKYHFYNPGYGWSKADMRRSQNYIVEFVRLVKAMRSSPDVIFVMNLFEHYSGADEEALIRENLDALQYLVDNGLHVIAVELGNEFYLYQEIVGLPGQVTYNPEDNNDVEFPDSGDAPEKKENLLQRWLRILTGKFTGKSKSNTSASAAVPAKFAQYEALCRRYTEGIAAIDPSIKTGAPLGNPKNKKHTAWNNFVLDRIDFVDAYVCHFYGVYNKKCGDNDFDCVRKSLDWYLKTQLVPALEIVEDSGKEAWVTEWNGLKFGHYGDENPWLRNSAVHQEYTRRFIELFKENGVTISNFHKIAGPMEGASYNAIDVDNGRCRTTPIYDVLLEHY